MSTQLATRGQEQFREIRALIESQKARIAEVLPRHLTPERLIRVACAGIARTPALLECTPRSLLLGVVVAARLGLEPDGLLGSAYLVPYGSRHTGQKEAQLIPGYRGLIDLARRSGAVRAVWASVIHANDRWSYRLGDEPRLEHEPLILGDRGEPIAVYCVAALDGEARPHVTVMRWDEVLAIKARSRASGGPWTTDLEEMAKKTVIRRASKMWPLSVEIAAGALLQAGAESGEATTGEAADVLGLPEGAEDAPTLDVAPAPKASAKLAEKLKGRKDSGGAPAPARQATPPAAVAEDEADGIAAGASPVESSASPARAPVPVVAVSIVDRALVGLRATAADADVAAPLLALVREAALAEADGDGALVAGASEAAGIVRGTTPRAPQLIALLEALREHCRRA